MGGNEYRGQDLIFFHMASCFLAVIVKEPVQAESLPTIHFRKHLVNDSVDQVLYTHDTGLDMKEEEGFAWAKIMVGHPSNAYEVENLG